MSNTEFEKEQVHQKMNKTTQTQEGSLQHTTPVKQPAAQNPLKDLSGKNDSIDMDQRSMIWMECRNEHALHEFEDRCFAAGCSLQS